MDFMSAAPIFMDLIEYIKYFPDQYMDPTVFITQREHEELCSVVYELLDSQNATAALPTVFQQLFTGLELNPHVKSKVVGSRRAQTRLRYALTYFCFFALRYHTQFFHPFDSSTSVQNRMVYQAKKQPQAESIPAYGYYLMFDVIKLIINNLYYLMHQAEPGGSLKVFGADSASTFEFERDELSPTPTVSQFSTLDNMSDADRELLKVTLDALACVRSKPHIELVLKFIYTEILEIPQSLEKHYENINREFAATTFRSHLTYQIIIVGAAIGAIGSMYGSSLALLYYCVGESKKVGEKQDAVFSEVLEDVQSTLMKLVLVYYDGVEIQDQLLTEACIATQKLDLKVPDPSPVETDSDIFTAEIFFYFICSFLLPIYYTCHQFEQLYPLPELAKYMNYHYVMVLNQQMHRSMVFAASHANPRNTSQFMFFALFQVLTYRAIHLDLSVPTTHISILSAMFTRQFIQPGQLLEVIEDNIGALVVSDYICSQIKCKLTVDYIKKFVTQSRQVDGHTGLRFHGECNAMLAMFRALMYRQSSVFGDRNAVHFVIHYFYRFTDLQFYNNIEQNQFFPSYCSCRLPQCVLEPNPPITNLSTEDQQANSQIILLKECQCEVSKLIKDMFDEDPTLNVTNIPRVCGIAAANAASGSALMEGLVLALHASDYYVCREVPYQATCRIYNTLVTLGAGQTGSYVLLEQFVQLDPVCKLAVMDCVSAYFCNRQTAGSIILTDVLSVPVKPLIYRPNILADTKIQADGLNKLYYQFLSDDFLGAEAPPDYEELFALPGQNGFSSADRYFESELEAPGSPFTFYQMPEKHVVNCVRQSCQIMTKSVHEINCLKIQYQLDKQATKPADRAILPAVVTIAWLGAYLLDETVLLKPETYLLRQIQSFLYEDVHRISKSQTELKPVDRLCSIKRSFFTLMDQYFTIYVNTDILALLKLPVSGYSISISLNRAMALDSFPNTTGINLYLFLYNAIGAITNDVLSARYHFPATLTPILLKFSAPPMPLPAPEQYPKDEPPKQPEQGGGKKKKNKKPAEAPEVKPDKKEPTDEKKDSDEKKPTDEKKPETIVPPKPVEINEFKPLSAFVSPAQSPVNVATFGYLLSSLVFDTLKCFDSDTISPIKSYSANETTPNKPSDQDLLQKAASFYCQAGLELFKNYFSEFSTETAVYYKVVAVFFYLLSEAVQLSTYYPNQRTQLIFQLLLLGFAKFLENKQLSVQNPHVWHVKLNQCEIVDLYEQTVNCLSQIYSKVTDVEIKNSCILLLKYLLVLLNTRTARYVNLPFKLDFVFKIHQLSPFVDEDLEQVLRFPYIQKCSIADAISVFAQQSGQQFCKVVAKSAVYNFQNYKRHECFLPDSLIFILYFHPQFYEYMKPLLQVAPVISTKHLYIFEDVIYAFEFVAQLRDQSGFSAGETFSAEIYVCCLKAIESLFKRAELVCDKLTEEFLMKIAKRTTIADMMWASQLASVREGRQTVESLFMLQRSFATQTSSAFLLETGRVIARLLPKLALNRKNYAVIQYVALEYALTDREHPQAAFVLIQALFLNNPIQMLKNFSYICLQNGVHALVILLALSCKNEHDSPSFFVYLFRGALCFASVFETYLFEITKRKAYVDEYEMADNLNIYEQQRSRLVENYLKDEHSSKCQYLNELIVEYKENLAVLALAAVNALALSQLMEKKQAVFVVQQFDRALDPSPINPDDIDEPPETFYKVFLQNLPLPSGEMTQYLLANYLNGFSTLIRAAADFLGVNFSVQYCEMLEKLNEHSGQFIKFLTARFMYTCNSLHWFDNDFFQVIQYVYYPASLLPQHIKVSNATRQSFHGQFPQLLRSTFKRFWPDIVIDQVEKFALFTKEWILGVGATIEKLPLATLNDAIDKNRVKQLSFALSGSYGLVNQMSTRFAQMVQNLLDDTALKNLAESECFQNVQLDFQRRTCGFEVQTWSPQASILLDMLEVAIQQLILPEELREPATDQKLLMLVRQSFVLSQPLIHCIATVHQYVVLNFQTLDDAQHSRVRKTLNLIKTMLTAQCTKASALNQFAQTAISTAQRVPTYAVCMQCGEILEALMLANVIMLPQALILIVARMIGLGRAKYGLDLLLVKYPYYFYAVEQAHVEAARKRLQLPDDEKMTEEQMKQLYIELFVELAAGQGVDGAVAVLVRGEK